MRWRQVELKLKDILTWCSKEIVGNLHNLEATKKSWSRNGTQKYVLLFVVINK